jgi:hypothetical protein
MIDRRQAPGSCSGGRFDVVRSCHLQAGDGRSCPERTSSKASKRQTMSKRRDPYTIGEII